MARVTHVARAQQRYKTVPVIDETTGKPKQTPVMRNGVQRTTKHDKPIFMTVTVADKTKPLPPETCDHCNQPIAIGTPYKHVTPKSGPYGGRKRSRHESCPSWQIWELSNSWSARIAQATADFSVDGVESPEDVESALQEVAQAIHELADESRETASNIEEGFGHPTSQSEEAEQRADDLDGWAEEIEAAEIPELPEPEAEQRWYAVNADGSGDVFEDTPEGWETEEEAQAALDDYLAQAEGSEDAEDFKVEQREWTPDEPTEEQMDEWRSEVEDAVAIVEESPV